MGSEIASALITGGVAFVGVIGQWVIAHGNSERAEKAEKRAENAEKRADAAEQQANDAAQREADATQNKELIDFATFFEGYSILAEVVFNSNLRVGEYLAKQLSYMDAYNNGETPFDERFIECVSSLNGSVESIRQNMSESSSELRHERDEGLIRYRQFAEEIQHIYDCANFFPNELPKQFDFFGATNISPYKGGHVSQYDTDVWKQIFADRSDNQKWSSAELEWREFIRDKFSIDGLEMVKADRDLSIEFRESTSALRDCISK